MRWIPRLSRAASHDGQSLVEFALVLPILLAMFVAVADFGRYFAAGVTIEAATRDAAEAAANQYLANPPSALNAPANPTNGQAYYDVLHTYAASVVCAESRSLPNTNYDSGTATCPDMPVVLVCVHDGTDGTGACSTRSDGGLTAIPSECTDLVPAPTSTHGPIAGDGTSPRWVEVRTCYHFTTIVKVPLAPFGDFWIQRTRQFTIACYFSQAGDCG